MMATWWSCRRNKFVVGKDLGRKIVQLLGDPGFRKGMGDMAAGASRGKMEHV